MQLISIDDAATLYSMSPRTIRDKIKVNQIKFAAQQVKRRMISTGAKFPTVQRIYLYDFLSLTNAIKKIKGSDHAE